MSKVSETLLKNSPAILSIGASDSGGGSGIQADLKTFSALGVFGTTALTCVTAQNPAGIGTVRAIESALVAEQIRKICEAFPIAAVKTGALISPEIIRVVVGEISTQGLPVLVVDPVIVDESGARLFQADGMDVLCRELLPNARVVTPGLREAEILCGRGISSLEDLRQAARDICERYDVACVAKGTRLGGDDENVVDVLFDEGEEFLFKGKRVPAVQSHGAGCAFSAAITAFLGKGFHLSEAVLRAKNFVGGTLRHAVEIGRFRPLNFNWTAAHGGESKT